MVPNTNCIMIDYDGVIVDTNRQKSKWITENLGLNIPPGKCDRTHCVEMIGLHEYMRMGKAVYGPELSLAAQPLPSLLEAVQNLSRSWKLIILSARPEKYLKWAIQWMENQKLTHYFEEIVTSHGREKLELADKMRAAIMLDDDTRHLMSTNYGHIARYHFDVDLESDHLWQPPIMHVRSWRTFYTIITPQV